MTSTTPRILVVDDDPEIRKLIARYVESQGFRVLLAANCQELREQLATHQVDLIVLDVMLPDGSGLDACRDLRAQRNNVPIILLTALKEDVDRIIGLEIGADDYLGKPFHYEELLARLEALLRRSTGRAAPELCVAGLCLDEERQCVRRDDGAEVALTGTEFRLLRYMMNHPDRVLSKSRLTEHVYDGDHDRDSNVLEVYVRRLRDKLGRDLIETRRGQGYLFRSQP